MEEFKFETHSLEETQSVGELLANNLFKGAVVTLSGDLGAGKTTFTGGVARALGVTEKVMSPTFNIMRCYFEARIPLFHIDAYRLEEGTNSDIGLEEFIEGNGACLIEWPNFISKLIPSDSLNIVIHNLGDNNREFIISTSSYAYSKFFKELKERY